jgi:hypothetical protein
VRFQWVTADSNKKSNSQAEGVGLQGAPPPPRSAWSPPPPLRGMGGKNRCRLILPHEMGEGAAPPEGSGVTKKSFPLSRPCLESRTGSRLRPRRGRAEPAIGKSIAQASDYRNTMYRVISVGRICGLEHRKRGRIRAAGKILVDAALEQLFIRRGPGEQGHGRAEF